MRTAGWKSGANRKTKPERANAAGTVSGPWGRAYPSAPSTSAAPDALETDRLPCLTTGTPAAAASRAAPVERL